MTIKRLSAISTPNNNQQTNIVRPTNNYHGRPVVNYDTPSQTSDTVYHLYGSIVYPTLPELILQYKKIYPNGKRS